MTEIVAAFVGAGVAVLAGLIGWLLKDQLGLFRRTLHWSDGNLANENARATVELGETTASFYSTTTHIQVPKRYEPIRDLVFFTSNEITEWGADSRFPDAEVINEGKNGRLLIPAIEAGQYNFWFVNGGEYSHGIVIEDVKCSNAKSERHWSAQVTFPNPVRDNIFTVVFVLFVAVAIAVFQLAGGGMSS